MDFFFFFKSLLLLFSFMGCCVGELREVEAVLGKKVTLEHKFPMPDYVVLLWNFNDGSQSGNAVTSSVAGLQVNARFTGRLTLNTTSGFLTLGPLTAADSGDYTVSIVSVRGTQTEEMALRVLQPVSDVTVTANLPEAIEHNSTVVLTCTAKGSFLDFSWFKGAVPFVPDGKRVTLKKEGASSILTFAGVLRTDLAAPVYCQASNKLEKEKSAGFNLTVYYGPDQVTITPPKPAQFINSVANFSLTCSSSSRPAATFTWHHNQQQMDAGGPILTLKVIKDHNFGSQLAEYTCKAKNDKTNREVPSAAVSFAVIDALSSVKISGPTATLIAGDSAANLSCKAAAGAVTTVTWLKDGKPLAAAGRLAFFSNTTSMGINPVQKDDNGEYTCRFMNPINTVEASYKMVVNYGPEPAMVSGENAVEVKDLQVELECSAASVPPANFTWKFNGTMTAVKTSTYLIKMARYKNSGTYTCEAHNAVTGKNSSYTHVLSVKEEGALDEGLSDGAIAGIVIAVLVALGAAIALIVYCRQKVPVESPY
ncbi:carcinoembryonic antigen-related cell adhesion molecule 5 [Cyclopterus lumpus]|uniref:Ig-like domain-containing protein n=1 Tax=Cyclopterus lumpus TaxID=8103 RepID=A0A8C2Z3D0_CYCLU|nr:carcinoembryonic antigen-related cell adhesion molecule 5 [Cyclopterus lumpus]